MAIQNINSQAEFDKLITSNSTDGKSRFASSHVIITCKITASRQFAISNFDDCTFKEDVFFTNAIFTVESSSFINTIFEKDVSFSNATFEKKVRFYGAKFKGATNFNNTKFLDLADFWNATFYSVTIFYKTDFLGTTVFSTTRFNKNVLFTYSLIDKVIIFRDTKFVLGLDLSLAIIAGEVSIFDMDINDFLDIHDTDDVGEYESNVSENGIITWKNKRETFRIIKNQLLKQNNNIDSLKFFKLETKTYSKQIHYEIFGRKELRKYFQRFIILKLNWWSGKYGSSWWWGVKFTLIVGVLFFYLTLLSTEHYYFGCDFKSLDFVQLFKHYFTYMMPTHKTDFMDNEVPGKMFYVLDFIGRIFISFGIYQTIQSFRQFKNK